MSTYPWLLAGLSVTSLIAAEAGNSLYAASLEACVRARQEAGLHDRTLIVLKNDITQNAYMFPLPVSVGTVRMEYVDYDGLRKRLHHSSDSLPAIAIEPMRNYRNVLTVHCEEFEVSRKKRTLFLRLTRGTTVRCQFDTSAGEFLFVAAERSGPQM